MLVKKKFLIILILFIVLLAGKINAFGVASSSSAEGLIMAPGESKEIKLILVLSPGEDSLILMPEILEGQEIAKIIGSTKEYKIDYGDEIPFNLRISMPANAELGKEYLIKIKISDVTPSENSGMVSFKGSLVDEIKVLCSIPEDKIGIAEKKASGLVWIGILTIMIFFILIVSASIWMIIRNRRN